MGQLISYQIVVTSERFINALGLQSHMNYFEKSQDVKDQIVNNPDIIKKIYQYLTGQTKLELISGGNNNFVYQLGKLESGLYVALRKFRWIDPDEPETAFLIYEDYCIEAETNFEKGRKVPSFSVGGALERIPFLLVEDLSEGKKWKVEEVSGKQYGYIYKEGKTEAVWFDFGSNNPTQFDSELEQIIDGIFTGETLKYFHPNARINIPLSQNPIK